MKILKGKNGKYKYSSVPKAMNPIYRDSFLKYLNDFEPLFEEAKKKCEFEFIFTLLRVKEFADAGWDPFETTQEVFSNVQILILKSREFSVVAHYALWLYGLVIEASEPYEIYSNLINIYKGKRFVNRNFPPKGKKQIPQSPGEKINKLNQNATEQYMSIALRPINEIYDRNLRNSIFHADYTIHRNEVRINNPVKIYTHEEMSSLLNKSLAYFRAFVTLLYRYINEYQKPIVVSVHPEFSKNPSEKAITIIRKKYGLVGLKDNWSEHELKCGRIPYRIGRFYKYEMKMLDGNPFLTILPRDRIKRINKLLKFFPKFISKKIVEEISRYYN